MALIEVLAALELLAAEELEALAAWRCPPVRNTRGQRVGAIRGEVALECP